MNSWGSWIKVRFESSLDQPFNNVSILQPSILKWAVTKTLLEELLKF